MQEPTLKNTKEDTIIVNLDTAKRSDLNRCLKDDICEIKITDEKNGYEEQTLSCTLKKFHMESDKTNDWIDYKYKKGTIVVWDMNGDEWRGGAWVQIPITSITYFEQLTGIPRTGVSQL